jgi:hypothetical protein
MLQHPLSSSILGMPMVPLLQQHLDLQTFKLCFLSNIETCINFDHLYFFFMIRLNFLYVF